jgi:hypothetical protein
MGKEEEVEELVWLCSIFVRLRRAAAAREQRMPGCAPVVPFSSFFFLAAIF